MTAPDPTGERTLVVFTFDAIERCMVGKVLQRFEDALLTVVGLKLCWPTQEVAEAYCNGLPMCAGSDDSYAAAVSFMLGGPVVAVVLQGIGVVDKVRRMVGGDSPNTAAPGTIRGDFAHQPLPPRGTVAPLVHCSADRDAAAREIDTWFYPEEIRWHRIAAHYFACLPLPAPPGPPPLEPPSLGKPSPVPRTRPQPGRQP